VNNHPDKSQRLDHIGFILNDAADVDQWCDYLRSQQVVIKAKPKTHRDGTRSFYCLDPDGNLVQLIHHPALVK
jgi:catechol 2,3-dioxygenase-like lactoylglutathione lyase family enzyme